VENAGDCDVFLAAGSLQYLEASLGTILESLHTRPRHLLINKTPLVEGDSVVTLQGIGVSFCPYHLFNRRAFLEPLERLGYELVDSWENAEQSCQIPFSVQRVDAYSGLYLRHKEATR